jgi:REP element-mobilizing transposase RayT
MVRWYHAIFTAYGFWLPNDPRGSWSTFVGSWELFKFGGSATKTEERRSLAHDPHDAVTRREVKQHLKYPPVRFDEPARLAIASGFAKACGDAEIVMHACCIGYDHCHVVTERHPVKTIEQVVALLKGRATQAMRAAACHPLARFARGDQALPTPWAEGLWKVFIDEEAQLQSAIGYVECHPMKEGLPTQEWDFVTPFTRKRFY